MFGGIATKGRLLALARGAARGEIRVYDLADSTLRSRFSYGGTEGGWADAGGIDLDEEGRIFVADTAGGRLRIFSSFGHEVGGFGLPEEASRPRDLKGMLAYPRSVVRDGTGRLWITCGDRPWVHGLQVFDAQGRFLSSLEAFGDRSRSFGPALDLTLFGEDVWVADTGNDALQVWRLDGGFLCSFEIPRDWGRRPQAIAAVGDRLALLLAEPRPRVLLVDRDFKRTGICRLPRNQTLENPSGLARGPEGRLFVLDRDGSRVLAFEGDGEFAEVYLEIAD